MRIPKYPYHPTVMRLTILICLGLVSTTCGPANSPVEFKGTKLNDHEGLIFKLPDQTNKLVSLSDMPGDATLLTFLFTNCTDTCPQVASSIKHAIDSLEGKLIINVVAISVDPKRDNRTTAKQFIKRNNLGNNWSFITGSISELNPIWEAYFIKPTSPIGSNALDSLKGSLKERYQIVHSNPVYLLNHQGIALVVHTAPVNSFDLASDIQSVAKISSENKNLPSQN